MTSELLIDELNTVETSVETWRDFIELSMNSEFYTLVRRHTGDNELAAALTLLRNYISIFSEEEQRRVENNVEEFYRYAQGFINELSPYRYSRSGYNDRVRSAFIGKIRTLLRGQKEPSGRIINPERYTFIRTLVRFCSSLEYIISVHDRYKQFLFRDWPQLKSQVDAS